MKDFNEGPKSHQYFRLSKSERNDEDNIAQYTQIQYPVAVWKGIFCFFFNTKLILLVRANERNEDVN